MCCLKPCVRIPFRICWKRTMWLCACGLACAHGALWQRLWPMLAAVCSNDTIHSLPMTEKRWVKNGCVPDIMVSYFSGMWRCDNYQMMTRDEGYYELVRQDAMNPYQDDANTDAGRQPSDGPEVAGNSSGGLIHPGMPSTTATCATYRDPSKWAWPPKSDIAAKKKRQPQITSGMCVLLSSTGAHTWRNRHGVAMCTRPLNLRTPRATGCF
mmetsp:Transcript_88385/g.153448  ORF Transcript_88385/g.153448 Transcript_88385/m.153448 type:complete len:211 (-) Transcript_88385:358-990(-)